jgi:hypothetical protein
MAPSRSGHDLDGPTFRRLADYAHTTVEDMGRSMDFVNLLPEWPGEAGSPKWDAAPDLRSWGVGQRASLLLADLLERPRITVVGLGAFVRDSLSWWWGMQTRGWLEPARILAAAPATTLCWSPHPAGTNMWWNDPAHRAAGEAFWSAVDLESRVRLPLTPRKVPVSMRTRWLLELLPAFGGDFPAECVDWPFVDPTGRPQALLRGASVTAAQVSLDMTGHPRPSKEHQALHSCDRGEECVNPGHLRWGTELENRLDQVERGRGSIGKLGIDAARDITERHQQLIAQLAEEHGCSETTVRNIILSKSWADRHWIAETKTETTA